MKRGILLAAFGAGNEQSATTLRLVRAAVEERFGLPARWAFTSGPLRERLARARTKSDSVLKALERMRFERYDQVAVQSLHVIPGLEYEGVLDDARRIATPDFRVSVGGPLLASAEDVTAATAALLRHMPPDRLPGEPVVCMGHGSGHAAEAWYGAWAESARAADPNLHIACMKGNVTLETVAPRLAGPRVWLLPLLSVVGRHTLHDMGGSRSGSWKKRLEDMGFEVRTDVRGLADGPDFVALWMDRLALALAVLDLRL